MPDDNLENLVGEYAQLAKEDKNIDATALMVNALQREDANRLSSKTKKWCYLISLAIPPAGILIGLVFYFSDKSDGKQTAYVCAALTTLSFIVSLILIKAVFNSAGVSPAQIEQIKPTDIYQLTQ